MGQSRGEVASVTTVMGSVWFGLTVSGHGCLGYRTSSDNPKGSCLPYTTSQGFLYAIRYTRTVTPCLSSVSILILDDSLLEHHNPHTGESGGSVPWT